MSLKAATLIAEIDVDTRGAERKISGFGKAMGGLLQGAIMGVGMAAAQGALNAAQGAMRNMGGAVQAASDLNETISKTNFLLGDSAKQLMGWSKNAATAMGMTQNQALQAASNFAVFGKAAGIAGDDLAGFSQQFVGLAADLASFYNTSPEQAIYAIGAAFRGESEPMRQYGVLLNEQVLKQRALAMGIIKTTKEALTPQQRILAAQAEIWAQTADAQGDFLRTDEELANLMRKNDALMGDFTATIGDGLLPAFKALYTAGNELVAGILPSIGTVIEMYVVPAMQKLAEWVSTTGQLFGNFFEKLARGGDPLGSLVETFSLQPIADAINEAIGWFEWLGNEWNRELNAMKVMTDGWVQHFILAVNEAINGINLISRDGNDFFNRFGAAAAAATGNPFTPSAPTTWIQPLAVPPSQVYDTPNTVLDRIPTTAGALGDLPELAPTFDATNTAAWDLGDALTSVAGTVGDTDKALSDLSSALGKIPGLMSTSPVTSQDMARAAAGLPVNYADNYVRRATDELVNGVDWADIDPAEVAASVGLDPSVPAQIIIDELTRQWETGEYFANPENLAKIDWQAVKDAALKEANAVLGNQNIMAEALAQGITVESFKPMATDGVGKMAGAITQAIYTPENTSALEDAGEQAYSIWFRGWQTGAANAPITPPGGLPTPPGGAIGPSQQVTLPNGFTLTIPPLPGNARGTSWWPGGATWVGEDGPEIVMPPRGSSIIPNDMAGGVNVTVNASVANDLDLDRLALRLATVIEQNRRRRR